MEHIENVLNNFREVPGLLPISDLRNLERFMEEFLELFKIVSPYQPYQGLSENEIEVIIKRIKWYINFKNTNNQDI